MDLPDDLVGDLRCLRQKHDRYVATRDLGNKPYHTMKRAEDDLLRAVCILFEYLPTEAPAVEKAS